MKRKYRYTKNRKRYVYVRRKRILILILLIFIIGVFSLFTIKNKFFAKEKNSKIVEVNQTVDSEQEDDSSKETVDLNQESSSDDTDEEEKDTEKVSINDPDADDAASVENYLDQLMKGETPEDDGRKVVYLSFDDGPSETNTPSVLKILKEENVKATFFVLGKSIDESATNRKLLKQEMDDGHAIGNHTYSHQYKHLYPDGNVDTDAFMSEIDKTNESLKNVLGEDFSTRAIRFPGGHMSWKNTEEVDQIMKEKDYHYIDWNALSGDAEVPHKNAAQLTERVKQTVGNKKKVILLMHDTYGKEETVKALPGIIEYLKSKDYEFRTIK